MARCEQMARKEIANSALLGRERVTAEVGPTPMMARVDRRERIWWRRVWYGMECDVWGIMRAGDGDWLSMAERTVLMDGNVVIRKS
jgi:hypothetical protein